MIHDDWDPDFQSRAMAQARATGGFYRTLVAARIEQHRSADGPTFRIRCGERFDGRILLAVPAGPTPYRAVLVALVDFQQADVVVNGRSDVRHRLELPAGKENILSIQTGPLGTGVHRLLLVFFDDDREPGLFGWHDLLADLYVGAEPTWAPLSDVKSLPSRGNAAVASADYGVFLTTSPDRLQLVGNIQWQPGLTVYASVYGSAKDPDRPIALVAFQNYQQVVAADLPRFLVVHSGAVTPVRISLSPPTDQSEAIRALIITNPDRELAPEGRYDSIHLHMALASQKAFLEAVR